MNLTRDEKIKRWSNHEARRQFLKTYKEWDEWVRVDELQLVFRKFEISEENWIVAMEYRGVYAYCESVKYFIHTPAKPFQPHPEQEYTITELLKKEKMRLQAEKRADKK